MPGAGGTALGWPPEPPCPAVCRLIRRHHFSTPRAWCTHERRKSGRGSPWRLERAHCCHGIVGTMPGAGGTALGWPPEPPCPAICRLVRRHHFSTPRAWCTHERRKSGRGSPWRLDLAHCCPGIVGTMPGAGGAAFGWPPEPSRLDVSVIQPYVSSLRCI